MVLDAVVDVVLDLVVDGGIVDDAVVDNMVVDEASPLMLIQAKDIFDVEVVGRPPPTGKLRSHVISTYGQQSLSVPMFTMSPATKTSVAEIGPPNFFPVLSTCWKYEPVNAPEHPMAGLSQVGFDISSHVTSAFEPSKVATWTLERSTDPFVTQLIWSSPDAAPTLDEASGPTRLDLSFSSEIATLWLSVRGEQSV